MPKTSCIFGSSPWDFLSAFLKVPNGMSYILEVPHIIFGNFGSFSSDFVHFWKLLLGCCVFMEVSHGNCCILEDSYGYCAILEVLHRILEVSYGIFCIFGSSSWDCVNFGSSL